MNQTAVKITLSLSGQFKRRDERLLTITPIYTLKTSQTGVFVAVIVVTVVF